VDSHKGILFTLSYKNCTELRIKDRKPIMQILYNLGAYIHCTIVLYLFLKYVTIEKWVL